MKLPEINFNEWIEAELKLKTLNKAPQPAGSLTSTQYAKLRSGSESHATKILKDMHTNGLARREKWGSHWVYWLKK